jgi:Aspartate/tyrosine/aromatic aminotransferase
MRKLVQKHDLYLIIDEVYREFCYDEDFYSVLRLAGLENHTVVIDSISKRFSACDPRIGSIVSQIESLIKACLTFAQLRVSATGFGQLLGGATFDLPPNYLETIKKEYDLRRHTLIDRF